MLYIYSFKDSTDKSNNKVLDSNQFELLLAGFKEGAPEIMLDFHLLNIKNKEWIRLYSINESLGNIKGEVTVFLNQQILQSFGKADIVLQEFCKDITDDVFKNDPSKNKILFGNEKQSNEKKIKIKNKSKNVNSFRWEGEPSFKQLLFKKLIEQNFIHPDTTIENFHKIFSGIRVNEIKAEEKIKWIVKTQRIPNSEINLASLYQFIFLLSNNELISKVGIDIDLANPDRVLYDMIWGCFCRKNGKDINRSTMRRTQKELEDYSAAPSKELCDIVLSLKTKR